jgi:nitrite reductase/ring-hydroxylating ferredoxin subunit
MSDTEIFVCEAVELEEGGKGVRFPVTAGLEDRTGFVVRYGGRVRGFLNRCAHVPIELDWNEGQF